MANRQLVLAVFPDELAADSAAVALKKSHVAHGDAIGILVLDAGGKLKQDKVGAHSSGKGAAHSARLTGDRRLRRSPCGERRRSDAPARTPARDDPWPADGYARAAARSSFRRTSLTRGRLCAAPRSRSRSSMRCQPSYSTR